MIKCLDTISFYKQILQCAIMQYRILGNTKLKASEIGLGCEWLNKQPTETVKSVIDKAIVNEINYFDIVYNFEAYLKNLRNAFKNHMRENLILTHHLGSGEKDGRYQKTRNIKKIMQYFDRYLEIMDVDYVDIGLVHFVMSEKQYKQCCQENGVFDLANQLKNDGKIRYIGMSTHDTNVAIQAAEQKTVDMVMFQVNMANNLMEDRNRALSVCKEKGLGIVAMKPFAGGRLLMEGSVSIAGYQRGGKGTKKTIKNPITPIKCLHYVLSQPGLNVVLPGVKNVSELDQILAYLVATPEEKDYSEVLKSFKEYKEGHCVFCDHCSPCPQGIDIGEVFRYYYMASIGDVSKIRSDYSKLTKKASDCIQCNVCILRCPFNVPILENMEKAIKLFGY